MKQLLIFLPVFVIGILSESCQAQTKESENSQVLSTTDEIDVYYFHFTKRCVTCKAIESESLQALETIYPDQYNSGQITFHSYNLDESDSKPVADKLKVSGQALLVVKGDDVKNLTNQGFMYARSNPAKLHTEIEKAIGKL
ncbi:nitrophenyl compound nitroreductase subunit ArsF family protein [Bacteroidota bacterium]